MKKNYLLSLFSCLFSLLSFSQTTYDFSTDATIVAGSPWNTQANITIGGVAYTLTSGGNGSFSNVGSGGESNSKCLRKDGSGGDSFTLQRADGQPFQFYGIWVNQQGMNSYSAFYALPPWYTLTASTYTYNDMTPMTAGTAWNNYTFSSAAISPGAGGIYTTSVSINFKAIIYYAIDNIIVGPAIVPNTAPTNMALSTSTVNENVAANTTVGTLSSTDSNAGDTFTYTLVSGTGSTDNASFNISGSNLRISNSPDFETKSSYSIRVRTTDQGSLFYEKQFTISINDLNESPSDIGLSATSVNENVAANTTVGTLSSTDVDASNTFTYTLVAGTGSTDNASFNISGSNLRITNSPDFETKSSYSIRVRTTDQGSLTFEKQFTIAINNLNESPSDISLSASSLNENVAANTTVGALSSIDADAGNTFTYSLVAGTGSTDNASFNISGSNLRITNSPDFETKSSYSIRVRSTDQGALTFEKQFTVTINNVNENPTDISLSASAINENVAANSTVGNFSTTDVDAGNTFTYTLVAGTGSTDNASFNISGTGLRITNSPDFETKSSYSIRVRTTDQGGLFFEKQFAITINDVAETPATHLHFDGIDDYVNCGTTLNSILDPLNSITVEAWVKPSTNSGLGVIVGNYANSNQSSMQFLLRRDNNNYSFWVNGESGVFKVVNATNAVTLNTWQHVAGVWNGSDLKIYVNGILMATTTGVTETSFASTSNSMFLGNNQAGTGAEKFTGSIDEVRIWNFARTIEQINGSKNCELSGSQSGLLAYYKFNQGVDQATNSGITILNATAGPNGTLTNFTLSGSTSNWLAGSAVTTGSIVPSNASVTSPIVYPQGAISTPLTATIGLNGTGLFWYTAATGGVGSSSAPTPSTATIGATSYWVSSTNANGCESARVQLIVNVVPANDECTGAVNLTVGPTSFNDFPLNVNLTGASNSGLPTPTCGNFQGGDLWYTVTVPASGNVVIETNGAGNYDSGLAVYSGNCGALNPISCDDNAGNNNYSYILLLGQTPGAILKVRVWENFFGNSNAQFQISAYEYVNPATHLNFDGSNDYVALPATAINNLPQGSIEVWIYPTATVLDNQTICSKQSNFENSYAILSLGGGNAANGKLHYQSKNGAYILSNATINANQWTHVVVTFTNAQAQMYINGTLDATAVGDFSLPNDTSVTATSLGAWLGDGGGQYFKGNIDEFRVWNAVLTPSDIANTMNCELQGSQTNIVTYYKFNQGFDAAINTSVTNLLDSVGSNTGTLTSFALTGATSNWQSGSTITIGNTCTVLSANNFDLASNIKLYPNPTSSILYLETEKLSNIYVELIDLNGRVLMSQSLNTTSNNIDLSSYNAAIYLLKVSSNEGTSTYKVIKN